MAVVASLYCQLKPSTSLKTSNFRSPKSPTKQREFITITTRRRRLAIVGQSDNDSDKISQQDDEVNDLGVKVALSMLKFYKREISPVMPNSCRYLPTCSEYSMQAYKRYGVVKGTVLTAWRLCRCNPLGGSGFDPPRWFGEASPPEE